MQIQLLTFNNDINISLQVGDVVYYSPTKTQPNSGFNTINTVGSITVFGIVTAIYHNGDASGTIPPNSILVIYDDVSGITPPSVTDYIMFGKNKLANSSSLKGYYASISFVNQSTEKIELFSVGSEASESSR